MRIIHLLVLFACLVSSSTARTSGQTQEVTSKNDAQDAPDPSSIVNEIIKSTLQRGEGTTPQGYRFSTWIPPTQEDLFRIKALGEQAVAPLSKYLDSPRPFAQLLAVRLLGEVGGAAAVEPLKRGLDASRWSVVRAQSLSSLASTPDSMALPIIQDMRKDSDPLVRKRAEDLLTLRYGQILANSAKP